MTKKMVEGNKFGQMDQCMMEDGLRVSSMVKLFLLIAKAFLKKLNGKMVKWLKQFPQSKIYNMILDQTS